MSTRRRTYMKRRLAASTTWTLIWMTMRGRRPLFLIKYVTWRGRRSSLSKKLRIVLKRVIVPISFWPAKWKRPRIRSKFCRTRPSGRISATLKAKWRTTNLLKRRVVMRLNPLLERSWTRLSCPSYLPSARSTTTGTWKVSSSTGCSRSRREPAVTRC